MTRSLSLLSISVALACLATQTFAMGGGGNLSPSQSPYAILAPQTLGYPPTDGRAAATTDEGLAAPGGVARSSRHPGRKASTHGWTSHGG
jgi:hypothetical protein